MKIFLFYKMGKKQGNKKRAVKRKGRFQNSCILLRFGNEPPGSEVPVLGRSREGGAPQGCETNSPKL
jgi:hypothetical protein